MQLQRLEGVANRGLQALAHKALALMPSEGVVAEVAAAEVAENDVSDVDDSSETFIVALADQEPAVWRLCDAFDVRTKLGGRGRRSRPRLM